MISRRYRWVVLLLVLLIVLFGGYSLYFSKNNRYQYITIEPNKGFKISLEVNPDYGDTSYDTGIANESEGKFKVLKGQYIYKVSASPDYESTKGLLTIDKEPINFKIPTPNLSEKKLSELAITEKASIINLLTREYGNGLSGYTPSGLRIYKTGDWASIKLIPSNQVQNDSLSLILKKENGYWVIKTDPPGLLLSSDQYPDIPVDIIQKVNSESISD